MSQNHQLTLPGGNYFRKSSDEFSQLWVLCRPGGQILSSDWSIEDAIEFCQNMNAEAGRILLGKDSMDALQYALEQPAKVIPGLAKLFDNQTAVQQEAEMCARDFFTHDPKLRTKENLTKILQQYGDTRVAFEKIAAMGRNRQLRSHLEELVADVKQFIGAVANHQVDSKNVTNVEKGCLYWMDRFQTLLKKIAE